MHIYVCTCCKCTEALEGHTKKKKRLTIISSREEDLNREAGEGGRLFY